MNPCIRIASLLLLVGAVGCSSSHPSLPLTYPTSVVDWHGDLDRVDFVQKFSLADYKKVIVEPINTAGVKLPAHDDNTYEPVVTALATSTTIFTKALQAKLQNIIQVEPANGTPPGKSLVVRGKITEIIPGSQAARYFVGYGAGRSETFLKGEIIDAATNQTLIKFENAKASSWGMVGGSYNNLFDDELTELGRSVGILISAFQTPQK